MRAVNLLPRQQVEQKRQVPSTVALVAGIGGAAVVLALVAGVLLANRSVNRQQQALDTARSVLAVTPSHQVSAKTNAFRSAVLSQREQRSLALAAAIGKRVAWDRILRRFALVLPDDVWITNLNGSVPLDSASAAAAAAATTSVATTPSALPAPATELTIQGCTYSQASVARLLERLQVVPDLENVQLQISATGSPCPPNLFNFTILSDIRQGRGAS
jgi:Tfp pilus assembly protein PilN